MKRLHVVASEFAQRAVRAAVDTTSPNDLVVGFRDPLNVGPLHDLDERPEVRSAFWAEVGFPHADWELMHANDVAACAMLRSAQVPVVVWHGPHPAEYLLAIRIAAMLRATDIDLYEIVQRAVSRHLPAFYGAVALANLDELVPLLDSAVSVCDVDARATHWNSLCERDDVYFRELSSAGVVELCSDAYDDRLLSACAPDWMPAVRVIGRVLADLPVGDGVIAWRMRALVATGTLQSRGDGPFGIGEIRRSEQRG